MTVVTLREVTGSQVDCAMIVRWRNANAGAFPDQEPWTVNGQYDWYNNVYRRDPSLNLYFVYADYRPIGTVGMSVKDGCGEMMWMVLGEKKYARSGYMRQGMRMLIEAYGLEYYWGRVKPDNTAGLQFQIDNGFTVEREEDGMFIVGLEFYGTWPEE